MGGSLSQPDPLSGRGRGKEGREFGKVVYMYIELSQ